MIRNAFPSRFVNSDARQTPLPPPSPHLHQPFLKCWWKSKQQCGKQIQPASALSWNVADKWNNNVVNKPPPPPPPPPPYPGHFSWILDSGSWTLNPDTGPNILYVRSKNETLSAHSAIYKSRCCLEKSHPAREINNQLNFICPMSLATLCVAGGGHIIRQLTIQQMLAMCSCFQKLSHVAHLILHSTWRKTSTRKLVSLSLMS